MYLIKNNVLRGDDVVGGEIKTPISFVVNGEIGIAGRTEHAQVLIGGGDAMEGKVWTGCADHFVGEVVQ
jgi:hypothetical protein